MNWNDLLDKSLLTVHEQMLIIAIIRLSGILDEDPRITYIRLTDEAKEDLSRGFATLIIEEK